MFLANQRIVAGDAIQIHQNAKDTRLPDPDSILLYEHDDKLAYVSLQNPTQRYVVGATPPITVTDSYVCTRNDDHVLVDSSARTELSVVLPDGVDVGKTVTVTDVSAVSLTNPIRVSASVPVHTTDVLMNTNGVSLTFLYSGSGWVII